MQTDNSVAHITGIWCFMLPDCLSPHYDREQHGPLRRQLRVILHAESQQLQAAAVLH